MVCSGREIVALAMQDVMDRLVTWAEDRSDGRAGIVLGSWARNEKPADDLSDLDLAVIVTEPSTFLADPSWVAAFGTPRLSLVEPTATGDFRELRVSFSDGRDVDFSIVPVAAIKQMLERKMPEDIANVFRRGFKVLVDKDRLTDSLTGNALPAPAVSKLPSRSAWQETGHDFLFHVILAAKKARRGELWVATASCNGYLKNLLLRLIEWHSQLKRPRDTWHRGRFLETWLSLTYCRRYRPRTQLIPWPVSNEPWKPIFCSTEHSDAKWRTLSATSFRRRRTHSQPSSYESSQLVSSQHPAFSSQ
jgi:aminoglycoside 6-adenylyltransferase